VAKAGALFSDTGASGGTGMISMFHVAISECLYVTLPFQPEAEFLQRNRIGDQEDKREGLMFGFSLNRILQFLAR
jgi:hypothetical protein